MNGKKYGLIGWVGAGLCCCGQLLAQVDPISRNLLQLGYDQSVDEQGPQALYAYYYYNDPTLMASNITLRAAIAPIYLDSELGIREVLTPYTDIGLGLYGGGFGDNYYEVRQGDYVKEESFDGHGGGAALSVYQLLNPGRMIPLHVVARGGFRHTMYDDTSRTADSFELPEDRLTTFVRGGLRLAGKEPVLNPDLGMELSVWYERQWRDNHAAYGLADDRAVASHTDLYWVYANLDYAWTNVGHKISFAVAAGGSESADRFSAWRLGGVLPLASEFPLLLPGYYHQEISAEGFVHFYASYLLPLTASHRWQLRLEAATARLDYLPGLELEDKWQTGAGAGISYTSKSKLYQVVLRYGYGFNAERDGETGAHSVGLLFQYDFEQLFAQRRQEP